MSPRRRLASVGVLGVLVVATLPGSSGAGGEEVNVTFRGAPAPPNVLVNAVANDTSAGDGTHITQLDPSIQVSPRQIQDVFIAFTDSTGLSDPNNPSSTGFAYSNDGGQRFTDIGPLPTGGPDRGIFGNPSLALRESDDDLFVANIFCRLSPGNVLRCPIGVSRSTDGGRTWGDPVPTWPAIDPDPAIAAGHVLVVDNSPTSPFTDRLYLAFGFGDADGRDSVMISTSEDSGVTWSTPNMLAGPNTVGLPSLVVGPDGAIYVAWSDLRGDLLGDTFDIHFSVSNDGGQTFSPPVPIFTGLPRGGTEVDCGTPQNPEPQRVYNGGVRVLDYPSVVVDSLDHLHIAYPQHGDGGDESDVFISSSTDGGTTWSQPRRVGAPAGAQFFPSIGVSPDGTVAVGFYDRRYGDPNIDVTVIFDDLMGGNPAQESVRVTGQSFPSWQLNPNYDTFVRNCPGLGDLGMAVPGSGAFLAWVDGRDAGPAGNNGVDPNIYFARVPEPAAATTTTLSIGKSARAIKATGTVTPPDPGGKVAVKLSRKSGGRFVKVASKRVTLADDGDYAASFGRPKAGKCKIKAAYKGDDEHLPSTKSKRFAC